MKNIIIFLLTLSSFFYIANVNAQIKNELKTPREIIDKHLEAIGGLDNLKKVNSIEILGTMDIMSIPTNIIIYMSLDAFYLNLDHPNFGMTNAINIKDNSGWTKFGDKVKDLTESEIYKTKRGMSGAMWINYYDPDRNNVRYELLENEEVNGNDAYVIDFYMDDTLSYTQYFDSKTFNMVKQNKNGQITEYSDFRKINDFNIYLPYELKTPQGEIKVNEYKLNEIIDEKLLKKPE